MPRYLKGLHGPLPSVMADRIRAERKRLGLTQEQAAKGLGIARATYKNLENVANPQCSTLLGLKNLGMDPKALLPELFKTTVTTPE
jgi:transcriptional regulator with XRE-family HTH domain